MSSLSRCFPYERNIVINALYDAIEALGLSLDSANSMRGIFIVSNTEHSGKMRIALDFVEGPGRTQLEICPESGDEAFVGTWSPVIIDELEGSMKRLYPIERSGK